MSLTFKIFQSQTLFQQIFVGLLGLNVIFLLEKCFGAAPDSFSLIQPDVEALVAVAILGIIVSGLTATFGTGSLAVRVVDIEAAGQRLATNQLEYTKSYSYDAGATGYPLVDAPPGYELAVTVQPVPGTDASIQKVTVTVSYDGEVVLTVEDYKVAR